MLLDTSKPQFIEISDHASQRIDNFLFTTLKGVPKSKIYTIIRKGEVRVNKGRIKPSYKLRARDMVRIPPIKTATPENQIPMDYGKKYKINDMIIYQSDHLIILNKPHGLAVHGGSGISFGLIELIRARYAHEGFFELVHRLDKDTSGAIMIARSRKMLKALHEMLKKGEITKRYHLIATGYARDNFDVKLPLTKFVLQSGERMVKVDPEGQKAHTKFRIINRQKNLSLLEAMPITGRTHQIRVHAKASSLPILGDEKYGDAKDNAPYNKLNGKHLALHARNLKFRCPVTNDDIDVTALYSHEMRGALEKLLLIDNGE